jgi:hypothetical protein
MKCLKKIQIRVLFPDDNAAFPVSVFSCPACKSQWYEVKSNGQTKFGKSECCHNDGLAFSLFIATFEDRESVEAEIKAREWVLPNGVYFALTVALLAVVPLNFFTWL